VKARNDLGQASRYGGLAQLTFDEDPAAEISNFFKCFALICFSPYSNIKKTLSSYMIFGVKSKFLGLFLELATVDMV
jgi:hypothetical protein